MSANLIKVDALPKLMTMKRVWFLDLSSSDDHQGVRPASLQNCATARHDWKIHGSALTVIDLSSS